MNLDSLRRRYAQRIGATAKIRTAGLIDAFATVAREDYLGVGPWAVLTLADGQPDYVETPTADISHLYQDAPIALDRARGLNNGQPSFLASCIDALELRPGDRVVHIGCGVGYYTAIMAEVVGATGSVLGIEIDPELASRARRNLAGLGSVTAIAADGSAFSLPQCDALLVNAGVSAVKTAWAESLAPKGRMLVPMTVEYDNRQGAPIGIGKLLKVNRCDDVFSARFISSVGIYHCAGARDPDTTEALRSSLARRDETRVRSLRIDRHEPGSECWLHGESFCLSALTTDAVHRRRT